MIENESDLVLCSKNILSESIAPTFKVIFYFTINLNLTKISNVTGTNLDYFKGFLNLLPVNNPLSNNMDMQTEVYFIDFLFPNIKLVLHPYFVQ